MSSIKSLPLKDLNEEIEWLGNMIEHNDKRQYPRKRVRLKGGFFIRVNESFKADKQHPEIAGVLDMSKNGAGVVTERPMSKGEKFILVCPTEKGQICLDLKVVRHMKTERAFRYGCTMADCQRIA